MTGRGQATERCPGFGDAAMVPPRAPEIDAASGPPSADLHFVRTPPRLTPTFPPPPDRGPPARPATSRC
jgi:hypothetical protein